VLTNAHHPNSIEEIEKKRKKSKGTQVRKRNKENKELIQAKEFKDQSLETPLHNFPPPQLITRVSGSSCEYKCKS
jgi:hypothetical protein